MQPLVLPWKLCSAGLVSLVFGQKSAANHCVCAGNVVLVVVVVLLVVVVGDGGQHDDGLNMSLSCARTW